MRHLISDTPGQMDVGLLVVNAAGRVVMTNPSAARYLGQPSEADLSNADTLALLAAFEIRGGTSWPDVFGRVLVDRQCVHFEAGHVDGEELFIQAAPLSMADSARHGMIINISDVRLLKESERKRAEALGFLSHDLRSPITSLLSLVQAHPQTADETSWHELTRRVEHYARTALHMADDFRRLARAQNLDSSSFGETDLVTVAHNALDESYAWARAKGIRIVRRMGVEEVWLSADAGLLERAFMNLLSNAIKYSPEGSRIDFELRADAKEVQCCIRDQGPGIPPDQTEKIFDPFHCIEDGQLRKRHGIGLGLAFVRLVVDKHGGHVKVSNLPGEGACFCLRLSRPTAD